MLEQLAKAGKGRVERLSRSGRIALAATLGLLSALSFAPLFLWPLAAVAFCGLVWLLDTSRRHREAAGLGWTFGFAHFAAGLYWLALAFGFQADMPQWAGLLAVVFLSACLAVYPALALWLASKLWSPSPARITLFAAAWAGAEWMRGHLLSGFPWNMIAQVWADTPLLLQSARLIGAYGLSLATVAVFAAFALLADGTRSSRRAMLAASVTALILVGDGALRLAGAPGDARQSLRVHLVQANIRQDIKWDPARQLDILQTYERMTAEALRDGKPAVVVWPETAVQYDVEGDGVTRFRIARLLLPDSRIILGAVGHSYGPDRSWIGARNSLLVVGASGDVQAVYDKSVLVPFGEYLPASGLLRQIGLTSVAAGSTRFLAGQGPVTLATGLPPFSPLICYEIIFPGGVAEPGSRPAWLLNISNDAWFGMSSGPHQHFAQARLRAVEEGLPVVRSTPTGVSGIIDAYGRVRASAGLGEQVVLTGELPPPLPATLYSQAGDWPFFILLASFLALSLRGRRRARFAE